KPIIVENIRANRTPPGLRPQHATGLQLVSVVSSGSRLSGAEKGSSTVEFHPGQLIRGKHYAADPGTAGAVSLLLQITLPCLLFNDSEDNNQTLTTKLTLEGGTNATLAPPIDYVIHVFFPFLKHYFGIEPSIELKKRGYYPKGGGEVLVSVPTLPRGRALPGLSLLERGAVTSIEGNVYVSGVLPTRLAEEVASAAINRLKSAGYEDGKNGIVVKIDAARDDNALGSGLGITLWANTDKGCIIGADALGEKKKSVTKVGEEAADELIVNLSHGGCVDEYLQDHLIIFMALAKGESSVRCGPLSMHTRYPNTDASDVKVCTERIP
ncbi:hypothetical protein FRC03_007404, partial [Tulasnella sp. 419]